MFLRERRKLAALVGLVTALSLVASACGSDEDDGASVREGGSDCSGGSGAGSASGSGSGSGSGSASGSGSGSAADCGSESSSESGSGEKCVYDGNTDTEPTGTVNVSLQEFQLTPTPDRIAAGTIQFVATNDGKEKHEVVIVQFDGAPADLPVDEDGGVDEDQLPDGAVIGEIEGFASSQVCAASFDLDAGKYVLFCNIVEEESDGSMEAHYHEGMYRAFTVT